MMTGAFCLTLLVISQLSCLQRVVETPIPIEPKPKSIVEGLRAPAVTLANLPQPRHVDDDWFELLDVAVKVSDFLCFSAVVSTQRGTRPVSAPVFSQTALAEAGIPMAPFDQPQTSTPIKTSRLEERKLEVTVEATEPSKIEALSEVKEDLLRHHASISELKRNFMEAVPEPRQSEWDKRLSTHSPFRTLGINGEPLPSADGVSSEKKTLHAETSSNFGVSEVSGPSESHQSEPDGVEALSAPVEEESCNHEEVVVFETLLVPLVDVEMAQLAPPVESSCRALDEIQEEEGTCPVASESSGGIVGPSPAYHFWSDGPQIIRCFQPPLVQTQTVTITAVSNSLPGDISTTEVPIVQTKTFTYESSKMTDEGTDEEKESSLSTSKTITSETSTGTTITTTTTHISKVSSPNRITLIFSVSSHILDLLNTFLLYSGGKKWILRDPCGEKNCHNSRL
ncbi:hypothetical protein GOODEAATRI_000378 [Goodea atripinnis]|uniref:SAB domain-containing protein n=1 Tax=Goodea atripinnis TaxID=208336 RepID=A0ABV0MDX1_9TELE